jgi:hypothetical protein
MVRQDVPLDYVNGRAESDLSSPLSRVHLLKVPLAYRWTETEDGRIINPAETGQRNREGSLELVEYLTDRIDDDDGEKWATVSIY